MLKTLGILFSLFALCVTLAGCVSQGPGANDPLGVGQATHDAAQSYGDQIAGSIANS